MTVAAERSEGSAALSRLQCWGAFALSDVASGEDVRPSGRKARALLAYMAMHPGRSIGRERLTGLLWGDRAEEQARASLRQAIFELKAFTHGARGLLSVERDHLVLNPAALVTDIDELHDRVRSGDLAGFLAALPDHDDQVFAGLDGVDPDFDDWLRIERARQREALMALMAEAAAAGFARGDHRQARALLARLHEFDPQDLTPDLSVRDAPPVRLPDDAAGPEQKARWRPPRRALLVGLAVGALAATGATLRDRGADAPVSIAVLPFANLSTHGDGHFATGLSEEILGRLARNPHFRVVGPPSTDRYATRQDDAQTIGRKLGVAYLLDGSVRTAGDELRVNVGLIRTRDGVQIWVQRHDGRLEDVLVVQDQIARAVEARLRADFAPRASAAGSATPDQTI
ncbi:hypothetical protein M9M90_06725 [Phenylobacterium sp. LH3H17]|uniref:hypothetical protein n=1 Tax=Phenylobacterium sp. LH3H17 TaxID=2903901 RepID=UPI0020C94A94|nr:hypothetical protein [Phenylobacterium sp. LH3H17]UTP40869.1 hypothetical protein M9M90_06725 [Phenylobacterium sp. LH3H17]